MKLEFHYLMRHAPQLYLTRFSFLRIGFLGDTKLMVVAYTKQSIEWIYGVNLFTDVEGSWASLCSIFSFII